LLALDIGERAAIELALQSGVPAILIDEIAGREAAARLGLEISGTVGLLRKAANAGAVDFESTMARLLETNFRISRSVVQQITRGK
jgi:predicted nucleic acid-binding protein